MQPIWKSPLIDPFVTYLNKFKVAIIRWLIPERIPWFAAPLYDRIASDAIGNYYQEVAQEIAAHISEGRILDVGCGPGYLPIQIATIATNVTIEGIDLSRAMIRIARANSVRARVSDRVTFKVGDGNSLNFADNFFDMIISTGALHAWKKPLRVLNECYRVLKPGCTARIYDPAQLGFSEAQQSWLKNLSWHDSLAYKWGKITSKALIPMPYNEIKVLIAQSNFRHASIEYEKWLKIILIK